MKAQESDTDSAIASKSVSVTTMELVKGYASSIYESWKQDLIYDFYTTTRAIQCLLPGHDSLNPLAGWTALQTPSLLGANDMLAAYHLVIGALRTVRTQLDSLQPASMPVQKS